MISGFNTDIEYNNTVYHVQTEDKGLKSRLIVSLVYDRGTILASKRASYDDLAEGEFDEKVLADRLTRQHKLICAAVKAGRIGELKEMAGKNRVKTVLAEAPVEVAVAETLANVPVTPVAAPVAVVSVEVERVVRYSSPNLVPPLVIPIEQPADDPFADEPIFDGVSIIEDDHILPAEAVAVVSELSGQERPANQKLSLELLGDSKFKGGDRRTVNVMVCRGTERKVMANAEIMVKVLGSSFRPVIFHARSDANGLAKVHLQLPKFEAGRAALLIRAISDGEEIELRRAVVPG